MSILSVDQISPIGSGTTITLNATEVKTGNEITVGTGASIFSPAGNTLTLGTNNVERIRIKNDGNIGINVTNPDRKLHVGGSFIRVDDGYGIDTSGSTEKVVLDNGFISLTTNSNERLRIDSSGRLGIGANNNDSYDTNARNVLIASSGNTGITIRSGGSSNYGMIHFADGTTGAAQQRAGRIVYEHSTDSLQVSTANTLAFKIDSSGSVNKPNNPAFYAYMATNNAVYSAGTIIPWANTHINIRSAFQTSGSDQGRFIVPTTGIYYFGWRLNRRDDSRFDLGIYQNGTVKYIDELRNQYSTANWQAESGHYLLSCTAGQKIDLRIFSVTNAGSGQFDGGGNGYYDAFFGWMIG